MRSKKVGTVLFVVAIGFAAIASYLAIHIIDSYRKVGEVVKVVKDIPPYTQIGDKDIQKEQVPLVAISPSSITDSKKVIGQYSKTFVPQGAILDSHDIATILSTNGGVAVPLSEMNNKDMRAIGLPEDYVHVLGDNLKDQDHVDLVGIFTKDKESFAKTIAQGVPILKRNPADKGGGVIVAVSAKQAEQISLAMSFGKLVVSLAPYQFENKPLEGTYLESLFMSGKVGGAK